MNRDQINKQVNDQIDLWLSLQKKRQVNVEFTNGATDLLCQIIENIEADKSTNWNYNTEDFNTAQEFAISLIPNALNDIYPYRRGWYENDFSKGYTISSWELLHSITNILDRLCFIPKKRR
jgi:hypothetical protein